MDNESKALEAEVWKIFHDHFSLPVDCEAEKPTYIFDES
jgi:hypothetical protein